MGSRLLRRQDEERRLIWADDDALATRPNDERWVEECDAQLKPGAVPTVFVVRGIGNTEMARINTLVGAGQIRVELAHFTLAVSATVAIENGAEVVTDKREIAEQLDNGYPTRLRLDLAQEVNWMAEGGPPGARRFRSAVDSDESRVDGAANRVAV